MQNTTYNKLKKSLQSTVAASLLMASAANADCTYQLFSIASSKGTTIAEFIDQLGNECEFSVIVSDPEAESYLAKELNKTNLKNLTIDEVLDLILTENNLAYTLENNILKISYVDTQTFNIDYILSQRKAKGSTDITLSSSSGQGGGGLGGASTDEASKGEAETGIKIESTEEVMFWEELDLELQRVLNRPEDTYQAEAPIINKNAGFITVSATAKQLKRLDAYLKNLQKKVTTQVLIDVQLLAVVLNDSSSTGVDWAQLYALQNLQVSVDYISTQNVISLTDGAIDTMGQQAVNNANAVQIQGGGSLKEVVKFLKTQGQVQAISNPKVLTLNNQPALITVGTEYFYKVKQASNQQGSGGGVVATVENDVINSVFAGVLLDITPEIAKNGNITLKINPSISQTRQDLSSSADAVAARDMPPDLDRRQLSSVVTVKDGARVILGGLINSKVNNTNSKVPLLGDIPGLGYFFKYEEKVKTVEELVIVIEPHIISPEGNNLSLADLGYTGIDDKQAGLIKVEEKEESK